jgi:hypothetical protein
LAVKRNSKKRPNPVRSGKPLPLEEGPLPEYYGPPRVSLLAIDPYHVCAYWDINVAALPERTEAVLRFHEIGTGASAGFDVPIDLTAKRAYVELWSPDKTYYADLGLRAQRERFALLARSGAVHTPRAWPVAEVGIAATAPLEASEPPLPEAPVVPEEAVLSAPSVHTAAHQLSVRRMPEPLAPTTDERPAAVLATPTPQSITTTQPVRRDSLLPVDAAAELHAKLTEIYGTSRWSPRVPQTLESASVAATPDEDTGVPKPPLPAEGARPIPRDLTRLAEEHFSRGAYSSPGGPGKPKVSSR